jgi:hypothetical protein
MNSAPQDPKPEQIESALTRKHMWFDSTTRRFLRWLFSKRTLSRFAFALAAFVTLVALFYAVENWRGRRAWNTYKQQMDAQGQNLDWTAIIPPKIADENNFAATPFLRLISRPWPEVEGELKKVWPTNFNAASARFESVRPKKSDNTVGRRLVDLPAWESAFLSISTKEKVQAAPGSENDSAARAKAATALLDHLKIYDPVLDELRQASARPQSRFNINYDVENPAAILLPHLAKIKEVCKVLQVRASAELALEQTDKAWQDAQLMLRICETLKGDPFLISYLVEIANFRLTTDLIWEGLGRHQWSESQLHDLQVRLQKIDLLPELEHAFQSERAWGLRIIECIQKNPQLAGQLFESGESNAQKSHPFWVMPLTLAPSGWVYFEKANYARLFPMPVNAAQTRRIDPVICLQNEKALEGALTRSSVLTMFFQHRLLSRLLLPALGKVQIRAAEAQTVADEAVLACALERYRLANGKYPEQLNALVPRFIEKLPHDIITGEPLIYRPAGEQYVLYSVGWNGNDDGGTEIMGEIPRGSKIAKDWVWRSQPLQ